MDYFIDFTDEEIAELKKTKPDGDDIKKLHAEINQLVNLFNMLNVASVAFFGIFISVLINKIETLPYKYILSSYDMFLAIISCIFYIGHKYLHTLRFISSYLIFTKSSVWEAHYELYHRGNGNKRRFLYSETRSILFIFLSLSPLFLIIPFLMEKIENIFFDKNLIFSAILLSVLLIMICKNGFDYNNHIGKGRFFCDWRDFFNNHKF